jgi:hypothetical protein
MLIGKGDSMIPTLTFAMDCEYPVAIREEDLSVVPFFILEAHELCTMCGERFGIGYLRAPKREVDISLVAVELPGKLMDILAKDHRRDREHEHIIELG